jgi:Fur family peroxide stress response transcriptional regulator
MATLPKVLKSSRQRDLVLQILRSAMCHPTADWIYEQARKRMAKISKATVYRNLKILKEEGKIRELSISPGIARYDGDIRMHYHIQCLKCGRVDNVPHVFPQVSIEEIGRATGYQVHSHRLEIRGICPCCQNRSHDQKHMLDEGSGKENLGVVGL